MNQTPETTAIHPPLQMLSFGAGTIGTYIGGSLALQGHQVVFLEKPEIAAKLRQQGLSLEIGGETRRVAAPLLEDNIESALSHAPYDVALFALKSYDTQAVLDSLSAHSEKLPPILCLQNGVENEQTIAARLGAERVIAASPKAALTSC